MKVSELIAKLKKFDGDLPVRLAQPTHDHWRNEVAVEVERVSEESLVWSDYHEEYKLPRAEALAASGERPDEVIDAVVLR